MIKVINIVWDTDDIDVDLPEKLEIPESELLYKSEPRETVSREEMYDRIADYLSDCYGWCVMSFHVEET